MKTLNRIAWLTFSVWSLATLPPISRAAEQRNPIQLENQKPGTTDWLLTKIKKGTKPPLYAPDDEPYDRGWRRRKELEGFCSHTSIRAGETLKVYVSTDPPASYKLDIYRMGWYGGKGARFMKSLGPLQGVVQPTPEDGVRSVKECKCNNHLHRAKRQSRVQCRDVLVEHGALRSARIHEPAAPLLQRKRRAHPAHHEECAQQDDCGRSGGTPW